MKEKIVNDNVSCLAHLLNQKYMNISLYESKKIPAYMYEQVNWKKSARNYPWQAKAKRLLWRLLRVC